MELGQLQGHHLEQYSDNFEHDDIYTVVKVAYIICTYSQVENECSNSQSYVYTGVLESFLAYSSMECAPLFTQV